MEIELTVRAQQDLEFWTKTGNTLVLKKIGVLLENILETLFSGIGKHEMQNMNYQANGRDVSRSPTD
jgi:toxin YoeB